LNLLYLSPLFRHESMIFDVSPDLMVAIVHYKKTHRN